MVGAATEHLMESLPELFCIKGKELLQDLSVLIFNSFDIRLGGTLWPTGVKLVVVQGCGDTSCQSCASVAVVSEVAIIVGPMGRALTLTTRAQPPKLVGG